MARRCRMQAQSATPTPDNHRLLGPAGDDGRSRRCNDTARCKVSPNSLAADPGTAENSRSVMLASGAHNGIWRKPKTGGVDKISSLSDFAEEAWLKVR
ncbi:hypothetical protein CFAM422_004604 [Trichoderma lentiforme]|uniref:Uncharacterized protein n=1 Tax=Trichoderma lentiforme TaxID=1567552 RepID=A0A9P4XG05_9HYPO|nr:hypothetical protein CFAM422_004604 [Trichoderma lentiforme]